MAPRKRLLILSFTDLSRDPRVNRQIRILRHRYSIVSAGTAPSGVEEVAFVRIPPFRLSALGLGSKARAATLLLVRQFERFYWGLEAVHGVSRQLEGENLDGVLANDIDSLPVALRVAKGAPVIFDAHEYAPRQFEDRLLFRLFLQGYRTYLCHRYMPRAAVSMTVSDGIAGEYAREIGVKPTVIMSLPDYEEVSPGESDEKVVRLVHHGGASRSRRLEELIRAMDFLNDRFELNFMLVEGSSGYLSELMRQAKGKDRVHFLDPVPMVEIVRSIHRFDLGVHLLPPLNFNQEHALPNKFFEFVQARLGIVVGPSAEMAKLVERHDLGIVTRDFSAESLAEALNRLSPNEVRRFKWNSHKAAHRFSLAGMQDKLYNLVEAALS